MPVSDTEAAPPVASPDTAPATNLRPLSRIETHLETMIRARYPIVYVVSWEERRVEESLREICSRRGKKLVQWTATNGLDGNVATRDPLAALDQVPGGADQTVYLFKDFHPFISEVVTTRKLRDLITVLKTSTKTIILLSPTLKLPTELEKEITVVDYQLPTTDELDKILEKIIQTVKNNPRVNVVLSELEREQILKAASGLTSNEAENVFARSLVEKGKFDIDVILGEKEQIIRKSGILEYFPASEAFGNVGGVDLLKAWMKERTASFTDEARKFGLPEPKGVLLLGVQGCGKSLIAKAIGSLWRLPLLRLDVGKIFAGIVGSSEENMRKAIATAESVAPCILWLDELEKGFSGTQSSGMSDGGTTSRVFSTFLTWLSEKKAPVFVIATSNNVTALPPELLRKGRFDEIFFVDLPSFEERREIFDIHLKRRHRDGKNYDLDLLSTRSLGYSGAEIEQVVISGLFTAFGDKMRDLSNDDMFKVMEATVPLSVTMRENVQELRDWAEQRAREASSVQVETMEEMIEKEAAILSERQIAAEKKAAEEAKAKEEAAKKPRTPRKAKVEEPVSEYDMEEQAKK